MQPNIEIDDETFQYLKDHAEPFVDSPADVIRRLIGLDGPSQAHDESETQVVAEVPRASREANAAQVSPAPPRRSSKAKRAARGSLLPEAEYEMPILEYLDRQGGRAPSREVIEGVGQALKELLTDVDKEKLRSGDVRWRNRVAFVRLRLVEKGDLDGHAPRGTWAITPQGKERVTRKDN